ncbi:hypothetical protein T492DRAFT_891858 [Pavlovales sp. CCMP2436]|nr:hypothetical protein T492DRAFT_891858 [Pavlovales sp. CCMP2436]
MTHNLLQSTINEIDFSLLTVQADSKSGDAVAQFHAVWGVIVARVDRADLASALKISDLEGFRELATIMRYLPDMPAVNSVDAKLQSTDFVNPIRFGLDKQFKFDQDRRGNDRAHEHNAQARAARSTTSADIDTDMSPHASAAAAQTGGRGGFGEQAPLRTQASWARAMDAAADAGADDPPRQQLESMLAAFNNDRYDRYSDADDAGLLDEHSPDGTYPLRDDNRLPTQAVARKTIVKKAVTFNDMGDIFEFLIDTGCAGENLFQSGILEKKSIIDIDGSISDATTSLLSGPKLIADGAVLHFETEASHICFRARASLTTLLMAHVQRNLHNFSLYRGEHPGQVTFVDFLSASQFDTRWSAEANRLEFKNADIFIDDFFSNITILYCKTRAEYLHLVKQYTMTIGKDFFTGGEIIKFVQTDGGSEFHSKHVEKVLFEAGPAISVTSSPHSPFI